MTHSNLKRKRRKAKRNYTVRRIKSSMRLFILAVVCLMPFLLLQTTAASEQEGYIELTVNPQEFKQGEAVPKPSVKVAASGNLDRVFDSETGHTVQDLAEEFKNGQGYTLQCEANGDTEGEFPIVITLSEELQTKLQREWLGLVEVKTTDGTMRVKNAVGEWDKDKFKKYDGTYIISDFVASMGQTYYFGEDGVKVIGQQQIDGGFYYFDKEGVMQAGWQELDGAKYYYTEQGPAAAGWQTIDEKEYYFGEDGKMATGDQQIGLLTCLFGEDGALISKKEIKVDPTKPMVALTFDDGPGARTEELLGVLDKYNVHATFFMLGQNVLSYPDAVRKMKDIGCELGNHSYDHADLGKLDASAIGRQVSQTNDNIKSIAGAGATVMRPPYGDVGGSVKASVGMPLILWNIDTLDWKTRNAKSTVDEIMNNAKDGDIILMHDIHTQSVDAAIEVIPKLLEKGFQLVTVSEMAAAKGQKLEQGKVYTDF